MGCSGASRHGLLNTPPASCRQQTTGYRLEIVEVDILTFETGEVDVEARNVGHLVHRERDALVILVEHFYREAEALQLLDQHLERFGYTRLEHILALDDGLVRLHAAHNIV